MLRVRTKQELGIRNEKLSALERDHAGVSRRALDPPKRRVEDD